MITRDFSIQMIYKKYPLQYTYFQTRNMFYRNFAFLRKNFSLKTFQLKNHIKISKLSTTLCIITQDVFYMR